MLLHLGAGVRVEIVLELLREGEHHVGATSVTRPRARLEDGAERVAERGARTVEAALHGVDRDAEDAGRLRSGETFRVPEQEHLAVVLRERAERDLDLRTELA